MPDLRDPWDLRYDDHLQPAFEAICEMIELAKGKIERNDRPDGDRKEQVRGELTLAKLHIAYAALGHAIAPEEIQSTDVPAPPDPYEVRFDHQGTPYLWNLALGDAPPNDSWHHASPDLPEEILEIPGRQIEE